MTIFVGIETRNFVFGGFRTPGQEERPPPKGNQRHHRKGITTGKSHHQQGKDASTGNRTHRWSSPTQLARYGFSVCSYNNHDRGISPETAQVAHDLHIEMLCDALPGLYHSLASSESSPHHVPISPKSSGFHISWSSNDTENKHTCLAPQLERLLNF